jgi:hypothetical protein
MTSGCTDCHRLSEKYDGATKRYLSLIHARQSSSGEHDADEIAALVLAADRERTEARNALLSHERQRHRRPDVPTEARARDSSAAGYSTAAQSEEQRVPACKRQEELAAEVQRHLQRLIELARAEKEAIALRAENMIMELDKQIEQTIGEKERSMGALNSHRQEHGC